MAATDSSWEDSFRARESLYRRLKEEALFALNEGTKADGIKTHLVHGRVKSLESLREKARKKDYAAPLDEVEDIVGVRVVVLFLSDLPRLDEIISNLFEVIDADDKVAGGDPASFGYMSIHYRVRLGSHHSGPRYDDLQELSFEIQTRTIVMDAWANVAHYLDYKGESSVPHDLRRDFFALSGLFYVADQHFEVFAERSQESRQNAEAELREDPLEAIDINLDTVAAYLADRFPDRIHAARQEISEFVEEITTVGFRRLDALGAAIDAGESGFSAYEELGSVTARGWYSDLGAARMALALGDDRYGEWKYGSNPSFLENLRRAGSESESKSVDGGN